MDFTEHCVVCSSHKLRFLALDCDSIQSEDIKHVFLYFEPILEHVAVYDIT